VAAFGALWGVLEITVGSFLHALHLPFTGVVLASTGAGLLVAQRQVLPRRGASLATGFVAALCKSMSPGGVVLGPMAGILVEAMLVEAALLAAPRSALTALPAGALAAIWAAFQKLFTQYLFYGGSVLDLYLSLLREASDAAGIPEESRASSLAIVLAAIALFGATGSVLGWRIGREGRRRLSPGVERGGP
jgi:hypothetical protein